MTPSSQSETPESARALLEFIDASPTPYHAVQEARAALETAGFRGLSEREPWTLSPGGRYYVIRNGSTIGAFIVGGTSAAEAGFRLVGAHTDSPNLRLKPHPEMERSGYMQLGVEIYGGVLLASWTDRDLTLAGRVIVDEGKGPETRLFHAGQVFARVPQLAIHLNREVNEQGLLLNKEQHLVPIVGLAASGTRFLPWLAAEVGVEPTQILSHELMFADVVPSCISGWSGEFVHAPRLDNLASCHAALSALLGACGEHMAATRAIVLYDNEEVGSATAQGAAGSFLEDLMTRILHATGEGPEGAARGRANSFLISADMAHAVHPNYADKHEVRHQPRMNEGPVIKFNANARYATDAESAATFQRLASEVGVPVQRFVMRADLPCGSTIGPIVSTRLGVKTVDVGNPMLSMHSCREMAGTRDHGQMTKVLQRFFEFDGSLFPA